MKGILLISLGRVMSIRISGSGLAFVDLAENGQFVQGICVQSTLTGPDSSQSQFRHFLRQIRRGDIYSMTSKFLPRTSNSLIAGIKGKPHRTKRGQLSIMATELPRMLSPCLHPLPTQLQDPETRIRHRHVDLQVNPRAADTLRLRSTVIAHIRRFLESRGYLEVQTPILANSAGGAVARPFSTSAIEFPDRHIELRTAPELWLKRLVLGGFERIFELGPCFRNEGTIAYPLQ